MSDFRKRRDESAPNRSAHAGSHRVKIIRHKLSIHGVTRMTGMEPSRIRFFETEFGEFFDTSDRTRQGAHFDQRRIQLLQTMNRMMFEEGRTTADVRAELRRLHGGDRSQLKVISVTSGKGGVGKTTISVNLAVTFARRGHRTLLLDGDLGLGNVHVLAGVDCRGTVADLLTGASAFPQILSEGPCGVKVLCAGSGVAKLADLDGKAIQRLGRELERLSGSFDVIVIDTGAGISAQVQHFLRMADDIVLVATPDIASMLDAYGLLKVARESGVRGTFHVLVNLADDPGQCQAVYSRIGQCSQRFLSYEPRWLGALMRDNAIQQANQKRAPLAAVTPESALAAQFGGFAQALMPAAAPRINPEGAAPSSAEAFADGDARIGERLEAVAAG